ncbi:MAG: integrase arm-type DNA-binding domain-containing protein [Spirochaetaceae bacterium]|nr:integrase arm-type DNA-binding domain-containing protein [Spirochaetaceae bacterium]
MGSTTGKRTARLRLTLNKRNVDALEPSDKPFIAWDDKLIGFGVRVQPSGLKSFIVNYRAGNGGRRAPNKRVVIGRFGPVTPDQARRIAYQMLGKVADGQDPADKRARARSMPTLHEAFLDYLSAKSFRSAKTGRTYRSAIERHLADWLSRPLDAIERREVEARFILLSREHGWAIGNQVISLLRSVYRRACVDHEGLRNPVDLWLAAGGRFNPIVRRVISSPAEALPYWQRGIEAVVKDPALRSIFWVAMYSGMRRGEILTLRWERVDLARGVVHVPHTKTGTPLELPITRQLASILEWRRSETGGNGWVFPSPASRSGHVSVLTHLYAPISRAGGRKFWFHGFRNCLITIADRELTLPRSLTKRLVNHARPTDVTEGYAADWTIGQLRGPAQRIADRIDEILEAGPECEQNEHRTAQPAPAITTRRRQHESAHPV